MTEFSPDLRHVAWAFFDNLEGPLRDAFDALPDDDKSEAVDQLEDAVKALSKFTPAPQSSLMQDKSGDRQTVATERVGFVRCPVCGGEFDEGEWRASDRCPECQSPKCIQNRDSRAGDFTDVSCTNPEGWRPIESDAPCRKCGVVGQIEYLIWESSCGGYEDEHYRCLVCGKDWWVEGPDA